MNAFLKKIETNFGIFFGAIGTKVVHFLNFNKVYHWTSLATGTQSLNSGKCATVNGSTSVPLYGGHMGGTHGGTDSAASGSGGGGIWSFLKYICTIV